MPESQDSTLEHPAVKMYRDTFRLCPNPGFRRDIAVTVQDVNRWKDILGLWKRSKWNPLKIGWMLSEYERTDGNGHR